LGRGLQDSGVTWRKGGQPDAVAKWNTLALKLFTQAIALDPKYVEARIKRGRCYGECQQYDKAVASYQESIAILEGLADPPPGELYNLACSYALLHGAALKKGSGLTGARAEAAAEQAVAALRRAIAAGYVDLANMRGDTDVDSLRKRPDFEKLLADLEAKLAAEKK
jgi:tetratricopeptide (TPR) repeat protein